MSRNISPSERSKGHKGINISTWGEDSLPCITLLLSLFRGMKRVAPDVDEESFVKDMGEDFDVVIHGQGIIEINPAGISKATGIRKVCEMLDIPHENTFAFGDSANDLEMLAYVAHSIAMGNGTEEVKNTAEYVTRSVDKDGILHGLKHYGLI